jgi:predicted nucleic acid-binding protein
VKKVYLETSIISYLAALPTRDLIKAARQQISWVWWNARRNDFALFVSQAVLREAERGDPDAAHRRTQLLAGIPVLSVTSEAEDLAAAILRERLLPPVAVDDALHLSLAVVHQMDFLLTWNCRHLANAELLPPLEQWIAHRNLRVPSVCTPDELLEKPDAS